jgi:hypothetical protein
MTTPRSPGMRSSCSGRPAAPLGAVIYCLLRWATTWRVNRRPGPTIASPGLVRAPYAPRIVVAVVVLVAFGLSFQRSYLPVGVLAGLGLFMACVAAMWSGSALIVVSVLITAMVAVGQGVDQNHGFSADRAIVFLRRGVTADSVVKGTIVARVETADASPNVKPRREEDCGKLNTVICGLLINNDGGGVMLATFRFPERPMLLHISADEAAGVAVVPARPYNDVNASRSVVTGPYWGGSQAAREGLRRIA